MRILIIPVQISSTFIPLLPSSAHNKQYRYWNLLLNSEANANYVLEKYFKYVILTMKHNAFVDSTYLRYFIDGWVDKEREICVE